MEEGAPETHSARVKARVRKSSPVKVERNLLARSDALAKNMGVTRAGMIARGLKAVLAAEGKL